MPVSQAETAATATPWHCQDADTVVAALASDGDRGLSSQEAAARLARFGPNALPLAPRKGSWLRLLRQFHNPLIYVLLVAAGITLLLRDYVDAGVILGVVVINAVIGFIQEGKAEKALDAVRAMLASHATVMRDGKHHDIDAATLVPGDIVLVESGSRIPADLRMLRVRNLRVNEAALTGESVPVDKDAPSVSADANLTGKNTEIGQIGALVGNVQTLATPPTRRLDPFARQITAAILIVGVLSFGMALLLVGFQLLFTYNPWMQQLFGTEPLDAMSWLLIACLGLGKFMAVEAKKAILRRMKIRSM